MDYELRINELESQLEDLQNEFTTLVSDYNELQKFCTDNYLSDLITLFPAIIKILQLQLLYDENYNLHWLYHKYGRELIGSNTYKALLPIFKHYENEVY